VISIHSTGQEKKCEQVRYEINNCPGSAKGRQLTDHLGNYQPLKDSAPCSKLAN